MSKEDNPEQTPEAGNPETESPETDAAAATVQATEAEDAGPPPVKPAAAVRQPPPAAPSSGSSITGVMALLLSLVALGVASYPAYELYRAQSGEQVNPLAADLEQLSNSVSSVEATANQALEAARAIDLSALSDAQQASAASQAQTREFVEQQLADIRHPCQSVSCQSGSRIRHCSSVKNEPLSKSTYL